MPRTLLEWVLVAGVMALYLVVGLVAPNLDRYLPARRKAQPLPPSTPAPPPTSALAPPPQPASPASPSVQQQAGD